MDLKSLSIEDLKILHAEITSLIEEKFVPKYKEENCFINPEDFSFGYILNIIDTEYEIVLDSFSCSSHSIIYVSEQYLDNCIFISQEDYNELYISRNDLFNNLYKFRDEKNKEIKDFTDSLEKEFHYKIQEIINEYKND